jgi:hypothetical protein
VLSATRLENSSDNHLHMTLSDKLAKVAKRHKMFLLLLILICDSHMHLLGNLDLCITLMTLMCCFMH